MPTNDFKPFAVGGGATVVSQAIYAAAVTLLANGFQNGIADPAYLNKVWRQSSIMAAVLGEFIVDKTGENVLDDGTTAALVANLKTAIFNNTALTGIPTVPTAAPGTATTQIASTEFVSAAIIALVDAAPGALDTLNELANALADDPNFATTITNALAALQTQIDALPAVTDMYFMSQI